MILSWFYILFKLGSRVWQADVDKCGTLTHEAGDFWCQKAWEEFTSALDQPATKACGLLCGTWEL